MKKRNLIVLLLASAFMIPAVSAANNPYKQVGPYGTNCTWYAWKMANEKAGVVLPGWGNAKNWYKDAKEDGYSVGQTPKANSIIVWGDWTSYGHVGYVASVEGNILHVWDSTGPCIDEDDPEYMECMANGVSEESDKICKANAKRIACEYTISPSQYTITGYIYLNEAPKKTNSTNNDTSKDQTSSTIVEAVKSSNANLNNLELDNGTIEFNKETLDYNVIVENEIDTISISATPEDEKAKISGVGDYKLNVGLNEVKIVVTAEDGSVKEYKVIITRNQKIEEDLNVNVKENNEISKNKNNKTIIIVGTSIGVLIIFILSICFIYKKKLRTK